MCLFSVIYNYQNTFHQSYEENLFLYACMQYQTYYKACICVRVCAHACVVWIVIWNKFE